MSSHYNLRDQPAEAVKDGRVLHVGNLHFKMKKPELEKLLQDQGVSGCLFYWSNPKNVDEEHLGWCRVQFVDRVTAEKARASLSELTVRGRQLKVGLPRKHSLSESAMADKPTPVSSHRPALAGTPLHPTHEPSLSTHELESLRLEQLPDDWIAQKDGFKASFFNRYKELDSAYEAAGVVSRFLLAEDANGNPKFHSRQYPSPASCDKDAAATTGYVFVNKTVTTGSSVRRTEARLVATPLVSDLKKEGWVTWDHPTPPTDNEKDSRSVERIEDVNKTDAPYKDTANLFAREIGLLSKMTKTKWEPGQLFGDNSEAQASTSFSSTLQLPGTLCDLRSATSSSHVHKYRRPALVSVGWGDYDLFHEWQSCGRHITEEMVEKKEWKVNEKGPITYEVASDSTNADAKAITISGELKSFSDTNDKVQPLWQQLSTKRKQRGNLGPGGAGQKGGLSKSSRPSRGKQSAPSWGSSRIDEWR
ncbi:hypothetical protein MGN70_002103 [Eutypa lata]|nr:hypothetical protein MGN70_002103 [Eutypa lata]